MKLTDEQLAIINSEGNIKINAVAGSGKTTTIIEYAKARPLKSRILYLAFNKSVKTEAIKKFKEKELYNVRVETAHSLAYRHIVPKYDYTVRQHGYKTHEIAELLGLEGNGEKHAEYIVANHINKFISYFCNSNKKKLNELNYLDVVSDPKAAAFVKTFYSYIEKKARLLLEKMDKREIEITHDFYLKKFHLSNPVLYYDYILFDEGQDASPAMLDIFHKQRATKVLVGDVHQQIYSWRYAINSLQKTDFKTCNLSKSFRFSQNIADLAMEVLKWKERLGNYVPVPIKGIEKGSGNGLKAVIARTNLGLLLKAIEYVREKKKVKRLYFEGNINSYTYADDGASLYDVLNLYNGKRRMIKDKLIKQMQDMDDLEDYIEKTEDLQLGMMVEIVKEYGNEIPDIIKSIKEKHIDEREEAEMIFSTVHRSKGMEYDAVQVVNDFINEERIEKYGKDGLIEAADKINEEINLLYVAITRTRKNLHIPEPLIPKGFPPSPQIHAFRVKNTTPGDRIKTSVLPIHLPNPVKDKAYRVEEIREKYQHAYQPWTEELDNELTKMFYSGLNAKDIAIHFGRTKGAIRKRIKRLELEDIYA
jgi:superfamily I DNA/RNA helicase